MATPARRHRSRRRVAAKNFLSNISLDGTYKDTRYAIFNKKNSCNSIDTCEEVLSNERRSERDGDCNDENQAPIINAASGSLENSTDNLAKSSCSSSPSKRTRASTYSGERPRRHRLFQGRTLSISEDEPTQSGADCDLANAVFQQSIQAVKSRHKSTSSSTSSLSSGSRPQLARKEVRFLKPGSDKIVKRERVVLLSSKKAPFVVYSNLPYNRKTVHHHKHEYQDGMRVRHTSGSGETLLLHGLLGTDRVEDGQDISYSQFLAPSRARFFKKTISQDSAGGLPSIAESAQSSPGIPTIQPRQAPVLRSMSLDPHTKFHYPTSLIYEREADGLAGELTYNPSFLDDPELCSGKHRTMMLFPSFMTSVIDYVKPSDLKKELNEKFRERFPHIQLTLSKLRSLKRDLRRIAHNKCGVDLWTVAQSYVFFEKIILRGLINKPNRRLVAGACLMLSAKLNDIKGAELSKLIEEIEDTFKLHRKDLLTYEFAVLVSLEFSLHIPDKEAYTHYQRLLYIS